MRPISQTSRFLNIPFNLLLALTLALTPALTLALTLASSRANAQSQTFGPDASAPPRPEAVLQTSTVQTSAVQASAVKSPAGPASDSRNTRLSLTQAAANAAFSFLPNRGQAPAADLFLARAPRVAIALDRDGLWIDTLQPASAAAPSRPEASSAGLAAHAPSPPPAEVSSVHLQFAGANPDARVEGLDPARERVNFLRGPDPAHWQTNLPAFSRVRYTSLYPGIDLVFYGELQRHLEYDLVVAPGADPGQIRLHIASSRGAAIDPAGDLQLDGPSGLTLMHPTLYQNLPEGKRLVAGAFVPLPSGDFGFSHAAYDRSRPLIIDPTINLIYATYAGGIHNDEAFDLALDPAGNAFLSGWSASQDFPVTSNALQQIRKNIGTYTYDAVVMKFDPSGNLLFSTYLGGSQNDSAGGVRVDANGLICLSGYTGSTDFPVTANALQPTYGGGGSDAFFSVLSNDGSQLLYSTFLGGTGDDSVSRMIQDPAPGGAFWLGGASSAAGLPVTAGAFQSKPNGVDTSFLAKVSFNPANAQPLTVNALTYIGGSTSFEEGGFVDLALDTTGNIYATGYTSSTDFPTTPNAFLKGSAFTFSGGCYNSPNPNTAITISEFTTDLKTLVYSSYLGGKIEDQNGYPVCNQIGRTIHPDSKGNIWVVGTVGMQDFPTTSNALSSKLNGNGLAGVDAFIAELTPGTQATTLTYGSYLGGSQFDYGATAAWDASNNIWITATTASTNWPGILQGTSLQSTNAGGYDTGILELSPDATKILYSTYLGGNGDEDANSGRGSIKIDANGSVHLAGGTGSANYPVTSNAVQSAYANGDAGPDGYDFYYAVLGGGTIGAISPVLVGNSGDTTISINGAGFQPGASCQLIQGSTTLSAAVVSVNKSGTSISCSFALNGAPTGSYTITVTNPNGGNTLSKAGALTVQAGGGPNLSAQIIGRAAVRIGTPSTFLITVTNSGSQDAQIVPLYVSLPAGIPFSLNNYTQAFSSSLATTVGSTSYVLFFLPGVSAGQTLTIPLQITAPTGITATSIPITASLQAPWFGSLADLNAAGSDTNYTPTCVAGANPAYQNCMGAYISIFAAGGVAVAANALPAQTLSADLPLNPRPDGGVGDACKKLSEFEKAYQQGMMDAMTDIKNGNQNSFKPPAIGTDGAFIGYTIGYATGIENAVAGFAGSLGHVIAVPVPQLSPSMIPQLFRHESLNNTAVTMPFASTPNAARPNDATACPLNPPPPPPPPILPTSPINPKPVGAIDPNDKTGSTGDASTSHFIRAGAPLPYNLAFENEPKATAPAAQVIVTDQLDPAKVDLSSVTLGTITFGSNVINLPGGTNNYNTTYKLSSTLSVRIEGSLNTQTGLLKWTFTSIDPHTGLPPTDPTVGFLPPDTDGVIGQGSVVFNALPRSGQATGAPIPNQAKVVFDANPAINTPTWMNTLDVDPPVSKVAALPASIASAGASTPIPIVWSGTDKGSGIVNYNIFVSDNAAPFALWLSQVKTASAVFPAQTNHTYAFFSQAMDGAGNLEAARTVGDATTAIVGASSTTTLSASATALNPGQPVTLTASVTSTVSGVATGTITFVSGSTSLGTAMLNASGVATFTVASLPAGANPITAMYAGDSNFAPSTSNTLSITVALTPTSTLLASSAATIAQGASVTFTATVAPASGTATPTGTVTFSNGATVLGTSPLAAGKAVYTTSTLPAGTDSITAGYGGSSTFAASSSPALAEVVSPPSFTLSVNPSTLTITKGQTGSATFTVTPSGGFNQAVSLSCAGLPAHTTCNFAPASVTPAGAPVTSTLTIATNVANAAVVQPDWPYHTSQPRSYAALILLGLGGLAARWSRRSRRQARKLLLLFPLLLTLGALSLGALSLAGCGGSSPAANPAVTPSGTSNVVVTAVGGGVTTSAVLVTIVP